MLVKKGGAPRKRNDFQFFKDVTQYRNSAKMNWAYPQRPLKMMHRYQFDPVSATDFNMFQVMLIDPIGQELSAEVTTLLDDFKDHFEANGPNPLEASFLCEMLPVLVLKTSDTGPRFYRGEVNVVELEKDKVNVHLIDVGRDAWVGPKQIYQPPLELLRHPKLVFQCSISQIVPIGGGKSKWNPHTDYLAILKGEQKCPSTLQFVSNVKGVWAVYASVDGLDVGLKAMMLHQIADVVPLKPLPESCLTAFPKFDFSDWLGVKMPMFSIRLLEAPELILQLETVKANQVNADISAYLQSTPSAFAIPFEKKEGSACLARYGSIEGEVFRGEICKVMYAGDRKMYGIRYVDYSEYGVVPESWVALIPENLRNVPECAAKVIVGEVISKCVPEKKLTDQQKAILASSLTDKDVFCTIVSVRYEWGGKNDAIAVTLQIPQNDSDFVGIKLSELLKIPEPAFSHPIAHFGPSLCNNIATQILTLNSQYYPGVTYPGVLSCGACFSSIFLQLDEDAEKAVRLTEEMTEFYTTCDQEEMESIQQQDLRTPGLYVAVEQEIDGEKGWYRAKVLRNVEHGKNTLIEVIYIDFGDVDQVNIANLRPLIPYFLKDPVLAIQAAVPVSGIMEADEDKQSAAILEYCEHGAVLLEVQLGKDGATNYAWVKKPGKAGLAEWMVGNRFAKVVIPRSQ